MKDFTQFKKELWSAADKLRANSGLKASEYASPVLGLIFLRFAEYKFTQAKKQIEPNRSARFRGMVSEKELVFSKKGIFVPEKARYSYLLNLPEKDDLAKAIETAMESIEQQNDRLKGVLPKNYHSIEKKTIKELLRKFDIDVDELNHKDDVFGDIYQYFLGEFARSEGQKGGEFFTPTSIVQVIVEIVEPRAGILYDPAAGGGGMFVQSARYIKRHGENPAEKIEIYGQERVADNIKLNSMNLVIHELEGEIKEANSYYKDEFDLLGRCSYVESNPPFNVKVKEIDTAAIKNKAHYVLGMPTNGTANYIWIQIFYHMLNETGRAGFVMANSASDASGTDLEIRKKLIKKGVVDVMVAVDSNFFLTVALPCTLWFLDRGKVNTDRKDKVLFINARGMYRQVDRKLREFKSGCVRKTELAERFPVFKKIAGLLVDSPIDAEFWDWNEEISDLETVRVLLQPQVERLKSQVLELLKPHLDQERKERLAALQAELPAIEQQVWKILIRYAGFKDLQDLRDSPELNAAKIDQYLKKELNRFKKKQADEKDDQTFTAWCQDQQTKYQKSLEKRLRELLLQHNALLDRQRVSFPIFGDDWQSLLENLFAEDARAALQLWEETFNTNHIKIIRDIVQAYRGEPGAKPYQDELGLCKVATIEQIEKQGWSLNPGRYVGVKPRIPKNFDFQKYFKKLKDEFRSLNMESQKLEHQIETNAEKLLMRVND